MDKRVAHANFRDANEALKGLGATYFIAFGTLLGAIREGDFLAHDSDIDFGVWGAEHHADIRTAFEDAGFRVYRLFGTPEHGYEQSFTRDGVKVDLFFFYPSEQGLWQGAWWRGEHLIIQDYKREVVLPPVEHTFREVETYTPARPEEMLEAIYGNWRKPNKGHRWYCDPKNIRQETLPPV